MKNYKFFLLLISFFYLSSALAQNVRFVTQGTIEYEKRVNTYAIIKAQVKMWGNDDTYAKIAVENYTKENPQFKIQKSKLTFNKNASLFVPIDESTKPSSGWFSDLIQFQQSNHILNNLQNGTSKVQKKVFEETYLVSDSLRKITWKITDETREIAGYNCRRANALVMDSIYAVAFYADEIPVNSGPESFTGLPGMVLGLALPHEHVTWFATSVSDMPISEEKLKLNEKGKAVNRAQLYEKLHSAIKDWGKTALVTLKWLML